MGGLRCVRYANGPASRYTRGDQRLNIVRIVMGGDNVLWSQNYNSSPANYRLSRQGRLTATVDLAA